MGCLGLCILALFGVVQSARVQVKQQERPSFNSSDDAEAVQKTGTLCDKFLIISYKQKSQDRDREGLWVFQPGWENQQIVSKKAGKCTRTYTASCTQGMIVTKTCENEEPIIEHRCLGSGAGDCSVMTINSRGTDLQKGQGETEMTVYDPYRTDGSVTLEEGRVSWEARAAEGSGIELKPIPKGPNYMNTWAALSGCYCCKHSYPILHSPFCYQSSLNRVPRVAWKRNGGTQECMNAWTYMGEDDILMLIPDFMYMLLDTFSLGITSTSACALACGMRDKSSFPEHSHYYKKGALSEPSCA